MQIVLSPVRSKLHIRIENSSMKHSIIPTRFKTYSTNIHSDIKQLNHFGHVARCQLHFLQLQLWGKAGF